MKQKIVITKDFLEFLCVLQYSRDYGSCSPKQTKKAVEIYGPLISSKYIVL